MSNETEGSFFHFLIYHPHATPSHNSLAENGNSLTHLLTHSLTHLLTYSLTHSLAHVGNYKTNFFDKILQDIQSRGLDTYVTIEEEGDMVNSRVDNFWPSMFEPNELVGAAQQGVEVSKQQINFKLPNNFRHRDAVKEVTLPNFAYDYSDFILSSMIERVSDSYELYLTTFFMCHLLVEPKIGTNTHLLTHSPNHLLTHSPNLLGTW